MNQIPFDLANLALESPDLTQQVLNFCEEAIVITDTDWRIKTFNDSYSLLIESVTGFIPEKGERIPELYTPDVEKIQPDLLTRSIETVYQARKVRLNLREDIEHINNFYLKGAHRRFLSRYRVLVDDMDQIIGFIESHSSIDKQNNQLKDLQQINKELIEGYRYQSHLLEQAGADISFSNQMLWGNISGKPRRDWLVGGGWQVGKSQPCLNRHSGTQIQRNSIHNF